ncbi:hypothetical protein B0I35DRAFT_433290 [Stachybotrys elegans]|uniref:DNA recombination and repair protein Rad51-like C-terminal domain-containing protein n=1 Tax=Stachybotrys elegans TaxID=80388 RepID=A0A8K0WRF2_9HYPO|nr:hypothetical protein B0I35DRAFT_433290 [Stachybotrys elegans]
MNAIEQSNILDLRRSQVSSRLDMEPISASVLVDDEFKRRNTLKALGPFRTGCTGIDDYVLMGGLERGSVVGISAEEEDIGLKLGLQTLVGELCAGQDRRALIVTPNPAGAILSALRAVLKTELKQQQQKQQVSMNDCLDRTMLSCVFDLDGLEEVLADLDGRHEPSSPPPPSPEAARSPSAISEVGDSQDEDALSPLVAASPPPPPPQRAAKKPSSSASLPHIILVTHFTTFMTSLFTQRDSAAAHAALHLLGSHLRRLSRTLPSSPLVLLLNTTTTAAADAAPLDSTLRSVFAASRRVKPKFGLVFSRLLDLHLLGARVARQEEEEGAGTSGDRSAGYITVLEVLLDELGLWEGKLGPRRSREQRWGAVVVENGRVSDAFSTMTQGRVS